MNSTSSATTGPQPAGDVVAARVSVALARADGAPRCRVEAPDRLLRMWQLLRATGDELQRVTLPSAAIPRLEAQLRAVTSELERSVSPDLAAELHHLLGGAGRTAPATPAQLRVEYSILLGWTGGLVIGMLGQLEAASGQLRWRGRPDAGARRSARAAPAAGRKPGQAPLA